MRLQVLSLASLSGVRIQHCLNCGVGCRHDQLYHLGLKTKPLSLMSCGGGAHLQHMEISGLGLELELQLLAYATATAM